MKHLSLFLLFSGIVSGIYSQNLQIVRGVIVNDLTLQPVAAAQVTLQGDSVFSILADESGEFSLHVPWGRYLLTVNKTGFVPYAQELVVNSAREVRQEISLKSNPITLDSIQIISQADRRLGEQSISIEKSMRMAANFFDPVRAVTSFPGVIATNDQNNSIIIRGNSPNGLLWRLNGLDIVNPNHLANAGTLNDKPLANGGGVNILSAQVLDNTRFYTGSIPTNYGNLLSGAIDMSFRKGNNQKSEVIAQASLIGLDISAEGPLNRNHKSSYLINYRYSTIGLLSQLGVDFGDESINFHDVSFNLNFPVSHGNFSFFSFAGKSKNTFEAKDSIDREEDKDWYDINYKATSYGVGLSYSGSLKNRIRLSYGLSYSSSNQERTSFFNRNIGRYAKDNYYATQSIASGFFNLSGAVLNGRVSVGVNASYQEDSLHDLTLPLFYIYNPCPSCLFDAGPQGKRGSYLIQPYWNWTMFLSKSFTMDVGFRLVYFSDIDYLTTEPRLSVSYTIDNTSSLQFSFGQTNQRQQLPIALKGIDLKPTIVNRYSLGYQYTSNYITWRTELYYQDLRDIPVDSTFSAFNFLNEDVPQGLRTIGRANNYGIETTVEKSFTNHNYLIAGASLYKSTYTDEYRECDSRFNGNYTFNLTYGREWLKQSKNRVFGVNSRLLYVGGLREAPVDYTLSKLQYETVYDYSQGYSQKLNDYVRLDCRISWTKNKSNHTRTLALDVQNLLSIENEAYHYYDFTNDKVMTKKQLGIIPILIYRIEF